MLILHCNVLTLFGCCGSTSSQRTLEVPIHNTAVSARYVQDVRYLGGLFLRLLYSVKIKTLRPTKRAKDVSKVGTVTTSVLNSLATKATLPTTGNDNLTLTTPSGSTGSSLIFQTPGINRLTIGWGGASRFYTLLWWKLFSKCIK